MLEAFLLWAVLVNPYTQLDMAVTSSINKDYELSILLLNNLKLKNVPFARQG